MRICEKNIIALRLLLLQLLDVFDLIISFQPNPLVGLMLASMLSAMMSSLAAVFNSASTVFTIDIYQRFINPGASEKRLVIVGTSFCFFFHAGVYF